MDSEQQSPQERVATWLNSSNPDGVGLDSDHLSVSNESTASSDTDNAEVKRGYLSLAAGLFLRILMTGLTGSGKSATGNTLLGEKRFKDKRSPKSVTREPQLEKGYNAGQNIQILDTPGFFDTELSDEEIATRIVESGTHLDPGPHIIAFVVNVLFKFDDKAKHAFERLKMFLGGKTVRHVVIVFTHIDQLDDDIEDFINDSLALKTVVAECEQCYVTLNNKSCDKNQVEHFFRVAEKRVGRKFLKIGMQNTDEISKKVEEADKNEISHRPYVMNLERTVATVNEARRGAERQAREACEEKRRTDTELARVQQERDEAIIEKEREEQERKEEKQHHDEKMANLKKTINKRKTYHRAFEGATVTGAVACAWVGVPVGATVFGVATAASQVLDKYVTPDVLDEVNDDSKKNE